MEKLGDLFSMVCHCEDKEKRREWLLYVRSEARKLLTADAYELLRKTYVPGAQDGSFDDYCIALEWYRAPEKRFYFLICATSGIFGWLGILAVSLLVYSGLVALFYGKRISAGQTLKQNRRV